MPKVVLTAAARADLSALDPVTADAVGEALTLLEGDPELGHGLVGRLSGLSSLRVGVYRIVYERRDRGKTTRVLVIRHRSVAYSRDLG